MSEQIYNNTTISNEYNGPDFVKKPAPVLDLNQFTEEREIESEVTQSEDARYRLDYSIFIPNWTNKPQERPAVLTLGGVSVLTYQNISAIIAAPGMGKSSICEAIPASLINPHSDSLGFKVSEDCAGVIYVDNERTQHDVWNSFSRMCMRADINYGDAVDKVTIAGLRSISRLGERLEAIEYLVQNNPCSLLLLDGAGDLVTETNDSGQARDCTIFLRRLTVNYNLSILTTLHPNPGSLKPRGHIGSEILRESECVMLAKKHQGESRIITTDFEAGKNRNNLKVTAAYGWSDEHRMFLSLDIDEVARRKIASSDVAKRYQAELLAESVLPPPLSLPHTKLLQKIQKQESISESTAKIRVKNMTEFKLIGKLENGFYSLLTQEGSKVQKGLNEGLIDT